MAAIQMQMLAGKTKPVSPWMCGRHARRYGVIIEVVNEPLDAVAPGADGATDGVLYALMGQALHGIATTTEALVVAFRRHAVPPLRHSLDALQVSIPNLHHCTQRHGISRLPQVEEAKSEMSTAVLFPGALLATARYRLTAFNSQACHETAKAGPPAQH